MTERTRKHSLGDLLDAQNYAGEMLELLNLSGGEITPEIETRMAEITQALPAKVDSFYLFLEDCDWKIKQLKANAEFSTRRAKAIENIAQQAKEYFKERMEFHHLTELKGHDYKYRLFTCPKRLVIEDETKIPEEFFVVTKELDRSKLKDALLEGKEVSGAHLEGGTALRGYSNL